MIDYFEWADEYEKESKKIKCCIEKHKEELKGKVTNSRRIELEQLVIKLNNIRKEHDVTAKHLRARGEMSSFIKVS